VFTPLNADKFTVHLTKSKVFACLVNNYQNPVMDKEKLKALRRKNLLRWLEGRTMPPAEKSYFSQLKKGVGSFGETAARRLEKDYNMGDFYLDQDHSDPNTSDEITTKSEDYITLDLLDVAASCGHGYIPDEFPEVVQKVEVLREWAEINLRTVRLSNVRVITAKGTSMKGTIENGDLLFIDVSVKYYSGDGVYVIYRDGHVLAKRLEKMHGNKLAVIADNPLSRSEELNANDANDVVICGKVVAAWTLKTFW